MTSLVRISFTRIINNALPNIGLTYTGIRNISGKTTRVQAPKPKPPPYPYNTKDYTMFHRLIDRTTSRMDENTKVIVVEGPVAAGKSKFAQELAEELEMTYYPEANQDMVLTNAYGYDLKQLDPQLPETCRSFDVDKFLLDPKNRLTATFQVQQYGVKFSQYIDALAEIFSTGRGVVLDRSCYSDFVFLEAMYSQGYVSKNARSFYYDLRQNTIDELLKPHLVIYLDVPVPKVMENIKARNISYERNSTVLNEDYLCVMEKFYKQKYLKDVSYRSELLVYDWSNEGEVEVVIEDIERLNFEKLDSHDPKFVDWRNKTEEDFAVLRKTYADKKDFLMCFFNLPRVDVPELLTDSTDIKRMVEVYESAPGERYDVGFNADMGDSSTIFKARASPRDTLPLTERKIR